MAKGTIPGTVLVSKSDTGPAAATGSDNPGTRSLIVQDMAEALRIVHAVWGGTLTLREHQEFLPQLPKEEDDAYADRLRRAVLFNALRRTVRGVTGMVWRKELAIGEDVPEAMRPHLDNIDLSGADLHTFAKEGFELKWRDGHVCYLIDWHGPSDAETESDEEGARPYWVRVKKGQVVRFRTEDRDGETVLVHFAYVEGDTVPDGEYSEKAIERVRQYELRRADTTDAAEAGERVEYRSWVRDADSDGEWDIETEPKYLGRRMRRIPVVVDYADRKGFMRSDPPFLDLALENLEHYRVRSERSMSLGVAGVAVFTIIGQVKKSEVETMAVGPSIGLLLPEGAEAKFVETSGNALEASRDELRDIEHRMASLGLSVLVRRDSRAQTAQAEQLHRHEQDSEVAASVKESTNALAECLKLHAEWMGLPEGGSAVVNTDLSALTLDAQTLNVLSTMQERRQISLETLWGALERGEILKIVDPAAEMESIAEDEERALDALFAATGGDGPEGSAAMDEDEGAA